MTANSRERGKWLPTEKGEGELGYFLIQLAISSLLSLEAERRIRIESLSVRVGVAIGIGLDLGNLGKEGRFLAASGSESPDRSACSTFRSIQKNTLDLNTTQTARQPEKLISSTEFTRRKTNKQVYI